MIVYEIFDKIESIDFEADLAIVSGSTLLMLILEKHELVKQLVDKLQEDSQAKIILTNRINQLLGAERITAYVHPHDSAITAYLYALKKLYPIQAFLVAKQILSTNQMRWAQWLANNIRESIHIAQMAASDTAVDTITTQRTFVTDFTQTKSGTATKGMLTFVRFHESEYRNALNIDDVTSESANSDDLKKFNSLAVG